MESTLTSAKDACVPLHQQARFDCEAPRLPGQPRNEKEPSSHTKCAIRCSVFVAGVAVGIFGFLTVSLLINHATITLRMASHGLGQGPDQGRIFGRAFFHAPASPQPRPKGNRASEVGMRGSGTEGPRMNEKEKSNILKAASEKMGMLDNLLDMRASQTSRRELLRGTPVAAAAAFAASRSSIAPIAEQIAVNPKVYLASYGLILYNAIKQKFMEPEPQKFLPETLSQKGMPRLIFAGEIHTQPLHHNFQLELIKAVHNMDTVPTLIGLEMCWRIHQPWLDNFVFGDAESGGGSISELAERVDWETTWGYPIELYAGILNYAREQGIRLCGLNIPFPVVKAVGKHGIRAVYDSVDDETRSNQLPSVDLGNREHKRRFKQAMDDMGFKLTPDDMQRKYEAQTLWDEFMASSISGYIEQPAAPRDGMWYPEINAAENRMVVLAGSNHIRGRVGIPDRVTRRTGLKTFTVVPVQVRPAHESEALDIGQPLPSSEADWVLYSKFDEILGA